MASLPNPNLTVTELSQVSPPPSTVVGDDKSLPLSFFDFFWLRAAPVHYLFFYEILSITETQFVEKIVPGLKHSLSTTLQHFYPFAGNLIVFPAPNKPEIRYVKGDFVQVTFAKTNQEFNELTQNHPRKCDKFYHLIPLLGEPTKTPDYIKIPLFSVQVTLFPHHGISIGMTNHHTLGDASTRFCFLKAWTSIARFGSAEPFLANGTLPVYDRMVKENPKIDECFLRYAKIESLYEEYATQSLSGPSEKVRATFILTRTAINQLKKTISTNLPTLSYVSSFTVTCAYIWSCIAKVRNDELQIFGFPIDCRTRMDPSIPAAYFGNCLGGCGTTEKTTLLRGKEGFLTAAKLLGECLHKALTETCGITSELESLPDMSTKETIIGVAGTPKLKVYEMNFGWGNPKKVETISIDYGLLISMNACNESDQDLEIGVSLSATEMDHFVSTFNDGLKTYI